MGGGGAGQNLEFENIMGDATNRNDFGQSLKNFCSRYNLDGVDLDYETPGNRGVTVQQINDYVALIAPVETAAPLG